MAFSLIVAASALITFAAAAPVQEGIRAGSLEARQALSCNIGTQVKQDAYDSLCWNALNITPYLTNWKATTPTCTDAENSAGQTLKCCVASEPWSTCFLRLATIKSNTYDCTQMSLTACSFPAQLDAALDPTIASQVNYIVLNIMMINNFFVNYDNALQNANQASGLNNILSSSVSDQLNLGNVGVNTQNVMAALTLGLAFPEFLTTTPKMSSASNDGTTTTYSVSKRSPQDPNTGTSVNHCDYSWVARYYQTGLHHRRQQPDKCPVGAQTESDPNAPGDLSLQPDSPPVIIFNQALQQSPNVAWAMWPSPPNSATDTLANLASSHFNNGASLGPILSAGLQLIMGDIGTFIAFAGNGIFSTRLLSADEPSAYRSGYSSAVDTYLLSKMLESKSISATPGAVLATNPCTSGRLCDSSYWSPVTGRQYTFSGSNAYSLINQAVGTMSVDLAVLFDGAYNCTFAGLAGGSVMNLKADNSLNLACVSVLPIYISGDCPEGATFVGGKCPFGHT